MPGTLPDFVDTTVNKTKKSSFLIGIIKQRRNRDNKQNLTKINDSPKHIKHNTLLLYSMDMVYNI